MLSGVTLSAVMLNVVAPPRMNRLSTKHLCLFGSCIYDDQKSFLRYILGANAIKPFLVVADAPGIFETFQPSPLFAGKAIGVEHLTGAPLGQFKALLTNIRSRRKGFLHGKTIQLICIEYRSKNSFYNIDTRGLYHKTFYSRNLLISVIS
jgi:hypothetical protein